MTEPLDLLDTERDVLLTARELSVVLRVSPETVLRWTRRADLPAVRLPGGAIRYRASAVRVWLAAREIGRPDEEEVCEQPLSPPGRA